MTEVKITTSRGELPTYVATPSAEGPWPGVVVIHDFGGMSQDLRHQADWLADGATWPPRPDLYWWGGMLRCLRTIIRELGRRQGCTFDDIEAARAWLAGQDQCRPDRGDRVLHGQRLCPGPGPGSRLPPPAPTMAAAPRTPSGCCPGRVRSWPAMAARTAPRWAIGPPPGWSGP